VLSVDAQVEGVHFDRGFLSLQQLGARAMASALSDLAAMGAEPRAALVSLICPPALNDDELYAIMDGVGQAQARYGCVVIGGNLARGVQLSITTTVIGAAIGRALTRSGAHAGDGLYVTGTLGSAALGLELLKRGQADRWQEHVERWRTPIARVEAGLLAARAGTHAAIDVSDGLLQDLQHVCEASSVGCVVDLPRLPRPRDAAIERELGVDLERLALSGGEDYELLVAAPEPPSGDFTRIGTFSAEIGIRLRDGSGVPRPAEASGFDHFGV
jgi:thiamine-monophosphate kinase